jgi:hypothetical protein
MHDTLFILTCPFPSRSNMPKIHRERHGAQVISDPLPQNLSFVTVWDHGNIGHGKTMELHRPGFNIEEWIHNTFTFYHLSNNMPKTQKTTTRKTYPTFREPEHCRSSHRKRSEGRGIQTITERLFFEPPPRERSERRDIHAITKPFPRLSRLSQPLPMGTIKETGSTFSTTPLKNLGKERQTGASFSAFQSRNDHSGPIFAGFRCNLALPCTILHLSTHQEGMRR